MLYLYLSALVNISPLSKLSCSIFKQFGFLPIEIAARQNRRKDVEILLPVTSRIPSVHDWSVDGMITYVNKQVEV